MDKESILDKLKIVSDEKAEKANFLVCATADTKSVFDDNLTDFCCECGVKVIHRWHAPRAPQRICIYCAVNLIKKGKMI